MKRNLFFLVFLCTFVNAFSQNTKFKAKKIELEFNQPEIFKNLKTFSYEIQDDGAYWDHEYREGDKSIEVFEEFPTLKSLTEGIKIDGLQLVEENGDIQIIVGFIGRQLEHTEKGILLKGTMNFMILKEGDQLVYNKIVPVNTVVNSKDFSTRTRFDRNRTKAIILTKEVQDYIDSKVGVLFTGKDKIDLYFGLFRKAKKGKAKEFNEVSEPLIKEIVETKSKETLDKAVKYWKEQLDVDFGKKLKKKRKLKVIYTNLATSSILLGDMEKATEYSKLAKKYAGFFDVFNDGFKNYSNKLKFVEENQNLKTNKLTKEGRFVYEINLKEEGVYDLGRKTRPFTKIVLQRFIPKSNSKSGIISLDQEKGLSPKAKLFVDGEPTYIYDCESKDSIKLKSGKTIIFKLIKGEYVPYVKVGDVEEGRLF